LITVTTTSRPVIHLILIAAIVAGAGLSTALLAQSKPLKGYQLSIKWVDKDSSFNAEPLKLQTDFASRLQCLDYVSGLPALLNRQGYPAASVDSLYYDSSRARIDLYLGNRQFLLGLNTDSVDHKLLRAIGFDEKALLNKPVDLSRLQQLRERLLSNYERNGYPFAVVSLDSIQFIQDSMRAVLRVDKGPLYHIDSIRVKGKLKISNSFLQRYLGIRNGSLYNKDKLDQVGKRFLELPYLQEQQPAELMMLGTGSILDVYLAPRKSSQVNFLVGFLPASTETNKLRLTGDVNLNLKNSLGTGETILVNWQQLQPASPRINLGFQQPYIFKSPFGLDFGFDLFKKDSSFLQLNAQLGIQYLLSASQSGKIFIQNQSSFLLGSGVDTNLVKATRQLPSNIDVKAVNLGVDYELNTTNYRFNPRTGNEFRLVGSVGVKTISPNNQVLALVDPSFNFASLYDTFKLRSYQLRARITAAHYFPSGRRSSLKTVINAGIYNSPAIFRNELFQIGGFKLLRGFDEESIYATRYGVLTMEYRNLVGLNSYLFAFIDAGWVKNRHQAVDASNQFTSAGLGLVFETKAGLLNMSFAVGKRDDVKFDLKQSSKIHFGYINYF
jgi:outer membrane protein assembly factor BamA